MAEPLVYLNDRFIPASEAALSIFDGGIVSGATITDFCRTYQRRLFRHEQHIARFRRDAEACFVPLRHDDDALAAIGRRLVEHNANLLPAGVEIALVSYATPGPIGFYAGQPGVDGPPTLVLHTVALPAERYRRFFDHGVSLAVVGHHAAHPDDLAPARHKHRSRLHWWRTERLLRGRSDIAPGSVAVLLDGPSGCVTETAIGNLLVVRGGVVSTPPVGWTLDGITLAIVRELCDALRIPFVEERLSVADCMASEEMLLVGSGFGVAGVKWFEKAEFVWPGVLTLRLIQAWDELVAR